MTSRPSPQISGVAVHDMALALSGKGALQIPRWKRPFLGTPDSPPGHFIGRQQLGTAGKASCLDFTQSCCLNGLSISDCVVGAVGVEAGDCL